jgi:hypothetical protein
MREMSALRRAIGAQNNAVLADVEEGVLGNKISQEKKIVHQKTPTFYRRALSDNGNSSTGSIFATCS